MLVLGFDTSTPAVTVAVGSVDPASATVSILASSFEVAANHHGELLAPMIDTALTTAGVVVGDLDAIGVGLGPGPFTGLRVGIVTARAMSDALAVPAYGESSLRLLALGRAAVATDARRKQVYWAISGETGFEAGPDIAGPAEAAGRFAAAGIRAVSGAGPVLYPEAFAGLVAAPDETYPRAALLIERVAHRVATKAPTDALAPMYLRRPDAQPPGRPKQVTPA
jgi:tRNA threonylcarbamoyladenosine biosynthesis protein TsaB